MRKTLHIVITSLILLCAWGVSGVFAQSGTGRPFITKWKGTKGEELTIPIVGTYKMVIKDESNNPVKEEKVTVTNYSYYTFTPDADGIYTVEAGPEGVKYMRTLTDDDWYDPIGKPSSLREVVQFGTVKWESMDRMFTMCENMTFASGIDTPDLSNVTNMNGMFFGCSSFNQPLNNWNVSKVTQMGRMFFYCSSFNQPLDNWNVSNVNDMRSLFYGCSSFNQPLDNWNVSNVTDMGGMFDNCSSFNQPLGNWNVSNVEYMREMFSGCTSFNQPLDNWNVSKVTDMSKMFYGCTSFDQPLNNWNVSNVTNMRSMFYGCPAFNQPLGSWKIKTVVGDLGATAISPSNYSQTLIGWAEQTDITNNLKFEYNVGGLVYNNQGKVARQKLIDKGWKFNDDIHQSSGVSITPRSLLLILNKEFTLPLEKWGVEETEEVTLSTDKGEIISYELTADKKGVHIKGLKEGKCKLTATIAAKPGVHDVYTSTCEIEVYIPIERITISPASKTLKVGEEFTFAVHFFPENATKREVTWGPKDSEIVTVDSNGKVTAKKAGKRIVYAAINEYGRKFTGRCEVTVVDEIAPVTDITIPEKQTIEIGVTTQLIAVVKPDNAEQGLVWSSSDPEIATVSEGFVWGKKKGECAITVKSLDETCTITKQCKITVEGPKFPVTLTQPTNGKIAIEGHGTETTITVEQGTTLTVTETPDKGYKLKSLTAGDEDITNTKQFTVTAATEVEAVFEKETFAVTPSVNNEAWGSIELTGASDLTAVPYGTELTVTVTKKEGYKLKSLTAGDKDITTARKFTVKAATEVKAVFELLTFQITPKVTGEGCSLTFKNAATDAVITDLGAVPYGTKVKVVPVPKEGWELKELSANGKDIFAAKEFTITAATTVTAVFEKQTFVVTTSVNNEAWGAIELTGASDLKAVEYGTELTVTVTKNEGYKLKTLTAGDEDITTARKFTVKAATEVKAVFEKETFVVTTSVNNEAWGAIAISGATDLTAVPYGTELTVKVTEKEGYKLKSLTAGDGDITTARKFAVKAATEVKAVFEKETFVVTTSVNNEAWGAIAISGATDLTAVPYDTELTVKVTENEGYKLKTLTAGDEDIMTALKFTVKAATTVTAIFESKQGGAVEDALLAGIAVAPNPFAAQLRIQNPEGIVARYEMVNAAGVVVRSGALSERELVVDTETLSAGVYFVRLEAQNGARKTLTVSK